MLQSGVHSFALNSKVLSSGSINTVLRSLLPKSLLECVSDSARLTIRRGGVSSIGNISSGVSLSSSSNSSFVSRYFIGNSLEAIVKGRALLSQISKSILTWDGIVFNSTLKKRRSKIKKHKLKKRRKGLRFNSKLSRQ